MFKESSQFALSNFVQLNVQSSLRCGSFVDTYTMQPHEQYTKECVVIKIFGHVKLKSLLYTETFTAGLTVQ